MKFRYSEKSSIWTCKITKEETRIFFTFILAIIGNGIFMQKRDEKFLCLTGFILIHWISFKNILKRKTFEPRERDYVFSRIILCICHVDWYGIYAIFEILKNTFNQKLLFQLY